jgi:hypothetical protein
MSIESRIREQKEKIKEDQRELSRLQDEARKKDEPRKLLASCGSRTPGSMANENIYTVRVCAESGPLPNFEEIEKAIESLSDTPSEPKNYVDWNDPKFASYNWAAVQPAEDFPTIALFSKKPILNKEIYGTGWWLSSDGTVWIGGEYKGNVPYYKSLIHRPGAKE